MRKRDTVLPESILRTQEPWCVAACGRFLKYRATHDPVWTLRNKTGHVAALIVQSKQNLLPVFCGQQDIPPPRFLRGLFSGIEVHSVQGLRDDIIALEAAMMQLGLQKAERHIEYDLMCIDRPPNSYCLSAGPTDLIIRKPQFTDMDAFAALHAGYEQEEVLPEGAVFSPAASRMNTEQIMSGEQALVAELRGRIVGKINTSAASFTRLQIGGVYVNPQYRDRGIACRMVAEFVTALIAQGKGVSLFVKKSNPAARAVYARLGFKTLGDYWISYF
jgi:ribosomal protein S18 acetylase RimI-like enzyme